MGGLEAGSSADVTGGPTTTSIWVLSIPSFEWAQLTSFPAMRLFTGVWLTMATTGKPNAY